MRSAVPLANSKGELGRAGPDAADSWRHFAAAENIYLTQSLSAVVVSRRCACSQVKLFERGALYSHNVSACMHRFTSAATTIRLLHGRLLLARAEGAPSGGMSDAAVTEPTRQRMSRMKAFVQPVRRAVRNGVVRTYDLVRSKFRPT